MRELGVVDNAKNHLYSAEAIDVLFSKLVRGDTSSNNILRAIPTNLTDQSFFKKQTKRNYIELDQFIAVNCEIASKVHNQFPKLFEKVEFYITQGLFHDLILKIKNSQSVSKKQCINSFDLDTALE